MQSHQRNKSNKGLTECSALVFAQRKLQVLLVLMLEAKKSCAVSSYPWAGCCQHGFDSLDGNCASGGFLDHICSVPRSGCGCDAVITQRASGWKGDASHMGRREKTQQRMAWPRVPSPHAAVGPSFLHFLSSSLLGHGTGDFCHVLGS